MLQYYPNGEIKKATQKLFGKGTKTFEMEYVDDGNLILFPEATHWVQHDAADEVNHYLIDFIFDTVSQIAIK